MSPFFDSRFSRLIETGSFQKHLSLREYFHSQSRLKEQTLPKGESFIRSLTGFAFAYGAAIFQLVFEIIWFRFWKSRKQMFGIDNFGERSCSLARRKQPGQNQPQARKPSEGNTVEPVQSTHPPFQRKADPYLRWTLYAIDEFLKLEIPWILWFFRFGQDQNGERNRQCDYDTCSIHLL